ncbi:MAG: response regulator [Erysipelotrichaceae bacterium]|nr:response regulator [Erysipelotrichaceae bacterium]
MKVIIADDEIHICSLLKHLIKWDELGLELVSVYNDGESLLEGFEEEPADILLCDIEMGAISGLDAIKEIKEKHPDCQCIIISGFRNFDYVQTAMKYGVNNYLLKPIDENDLNATLRSVIDKMNVQQNGYDVIANHAARKKLYDMLDRLGDHTDLDTLNRTYHYHFSDGLFFFVHAIFTRLDFASETLPQIASTYSEELKRRMSDYCFDMECFDVSANSVTTIINCKNEEESIPKKTFDAIFREICIRMDAMFGCTCYMGISSSSADIDHLGKQKDEATTVLVNRFAYPELRCFYTGDHSAQYVTGELDILERNEIINKIQSADIKEVTDWIRRFFIKKNDIISKNPQIIVTYYFLIFELLNNEIYEISSRQENKAFVRNRGILLYENSRSKEDLINHLCMIAEELMEDCLSFRKNNASIYIQQAKDYLDHSYHERKGDQGSDRFFQQEYEIHSEADRDARGFRCDFRWQQYHPFQTGSGSLSESGRDAGYRAGRMSGRRRCFSGDRSSQNRQYVCGGRWRCHQERTG